MRRRSTAGPSRRPRCWRRSRRTTERTGGPRCGNAMPRWCGDPPRARRGARGGVRAGAGVPTARDAAVSARRTAVACRHRRGGEVAGRLRAGGRVVGCRAHRHGGALAVRPRPTESLPGGGRRRRVGRGTGRAAHAAGRGRVARLIRRASCAPHRGAGGRITRGSRWPGVAGCRWCAGGSSARGCRRPSHSTGSARPGGRPRRWCGGWTSTSARPRKTPASASPLPLHVGVPPARPLLRRQPPRQQAGLVHAGGRPSARPLLAQACPAAPVRAGPVIGAVALNGRASTRWRRPGVGRGHGRR